jgi:hypothetical protein
MFGRFKPVPFEPYGRRRSRWRLPRWLVLLLIGLIGGAAGVIYVQERHLPPRLSASESTRLKSAFEQADAERTQLRGQLEDTTAKLNAALAQSERAVADSQANQALVARLRADVGAAVAAMPPDPRGGSVEVRAGQFSARDGNLSYQVVLARPQGGGKPLDGTLQLVVTGDGERGAETAVTLKPVDVSISAHEVLRGSLPLPAGFKARQATIRVMTRGGGQQLGMRVMIVQ